MDEPFLMPNGRQMQYVGDSNGGAAKVINCRCVIVYVDVEDEVTDSKVPVKPDGIPVDSEGRPLGLNGAAMQKKYGALTGAARTEAIRNAKDRIADTVEKNAETWGDLKDKVRFYGHRNKLEYGKITGDLFGDEADSATLFALDEITQELNVLASLLGAKPIRGYKLINRRDALSGS